MPHGDVELVIDAAHFSRIVRDGILQAEVSIDIMTADFKALLVPELVTRPSGFDCHAFSQTCREGR